MVAESNRSVSLGVGEQRRAGEIDAQGHKEISKADGYFHSLNCGGIFTDGYVHQHLSNCTS